MNSPRNRQGGFAMPALFLAVLVGFVGSLNVKGNDGTTVAAAMGLIDSGERSEFATLETRETSE